MKSLSIAVAVCVFALAGGLLLAAEAPALVRIERKNVDDLTVLRSAGIPIVLETRFSLFILGGPGDLEALAKRGYEAKVLDRETAGSDYLMVGVRPDTDMNAIREAGVVLFAEENMLLLRVPAGMDDGVVHDARAFVSRLPKHPVAVPKPPPAPESRPSVLIPNPIVQKIVSTVADADIQSYWQTIVNNPPNATRFSTTQGCRDAATTCFNTYTGLKLQSQNQVWSVSNAPNVIGTHLGATRPGDVYIIVAHLDDLPSSGTAPGGDDNGSGTASVLEAAKTLSCWGVRNTVKFLNVTGEEQGLFGSDAYAADALTRGENILGVINYDMIGWAGDGIPAGENLDLDFNASSQWLAQRFSDAAATYGTGLAVNAFLCPSLTVSDHYPFWQRGWSAICGITDNEGYCGQAGNYPFYHQATDTIANSGNPAFFYKVVKATVATLAELADPFKITFGGAGYACGSPVSVLVADRDLNTNAGTAQSVAVHVWSASVPAGETMTLNERGNDSMIFDGSMPTTGGPAVGGDGVLSISAGDTLHAEYLDALDCDGASAVTYAATASVDCTAPVISGVAASSVTGNSATIGWTTDESATGVVHYGTAPPGSSSTASSALTTSHALGLTGLSECTNYSYWVESADGVGNTASDNAGGTYYAFATVKNTAPSYVSSGGPLAIPDNNAAGVTMTINVPDDKIVQDVNVRVNVVHTYDNDLTLTLIPPVGSPILLSNRRGASGDNFTNTVFDDAAATPIASGTAPFTGSFIPDAPLSSANGIHSIGAWGFKAVDAAGLDTGTIQNWTLMLTYPTAQCGPHAAYASQGNVGDVCTIGGPGNANGTWDPGERVQLSVGITNDGTDPLTGLIGTLSSSTPGVVMTDGTADFPTVGAGASVNSSSPHFTVTLPQGLACGSLVSFNLTIAGAQGSWGGSFTHGIGAIAPGGGTALDEHFAAGIPATWTVVNGGTGGGAAATWTTANPGARAFTAPLVAPVAIVDSDNATSAATQDEQLITPVMNLATATTVTLQFDQYFRWYSGGQNEFGDVDVRSSATGGAWVNVFRNQGGDSANPNHRTLNISAQAAGAADVQVRFHYYQANFEWWWEVDNVNVTFTSPGVCSMNVCLAPPPSPPPVPDGSFGAAMASTRAAADGSSIGLSWDASSCTATGYKVLYGTLSGVSSYALDGSVCALGTGGGATWSSVPAGDLWYVVVATDGAGTEGSWGNATTGPVGGTTASAQCGDSARSNAGSCP